MSMQPQSWPQPSDEIVAAVTAMYRGRRAPLPVVIRDELGELFADEQFAASFGARGRPAWSPGRLALVTALQMAENLTDRQAAEAVRLRIDWKYCLGLALTDEGFDASVLCEFRTRVLAHGLEEKTLDLLLAGLVERGLLKSGGKQRTDSTHVLAAVRDLNRLELAGETVRACLEALAAAAPDWLAATIDVEDWNARYGVRVDSWRLPTSETKRTALATAYGVDGFTLLEAVYAPDAPAWLANLPAVEVLRVVLLQNYTRTTDRRGREVIRAGPVPDARGGHVPIPRDHDGVLLVQDRVENRLVRQPWRPRLPTRSAHEVEFLRAGRPPQDHRLPHRDTPSWSRQGTGRFPSQAVARRFR